MTEHRVVERETITKDSGEHPATIETDTVSGVRHGDEEAGGAVAGAVVGAVAGAVVGGAIGAAAGATTGALDAKAKDDTVVVTHEVRHS
jgi:outer membrane lipoprotein SlyB